MKHRLGFSYRKIVDLFDSHFGLQVCPGTLVRGGQRLARFGAGTYGALVTILLASLVVCGDAEG